VEIRVGDTITFFNVDLVPHTATAADKSFDTGTLRKDESADLTFPTAGEFAYVCRFHPHMKGRVTVR
jgi:plastocyanin